MGDAGFGPATAMSKKTTREVTALHQIAGRLGPLCNVLSPSSAPDKYEYVYIT